MAREPAGSDGTDTADSNELPQCDCVDLHAEIKLCVERLNIIVEEKKNVGGEAACGRVCPLLPPPLIISLPKFIVLYKTFIHNSYYCTTATLLKLDRRTSSIGRARSLVAEEGQLRLSSPPTGPGGGGRGSRSARSSGCGRGRRDGVGAMEEDLPHELNDAVMAELKILSKPGQWVAVVELRQHVPRRRTFLYLVQLLVKHGQAALAPAPGGLDFFGSRSHAARLVDFLGTVAPIQTDTAKRLVFHDTERSSPDASFFLFSPRADPTRMQSVYQDIK
ncbi:hypothetical protein QYE76_012098 [Lolium multiflorum]|uniref:60S ribosomal export protein NMD3 n=1 Tax=Lolium multiflorum TaxID=4521 RepID=A0AAD8X3L3_LOLMU|nr:hypothetical protein QYE76_012098 [Lolium multiflorum]